MLGLLANDHTDGGARLVRDAFDRESWLFKLKWDGFRAVAENDPTQRGCQVLFLEIRVTSRRRFPPIADALTNPEKGQPFLDGQIVALDEGGPA